MARPPGHGPGYEIRREEIIDTAAALFAKKGYAATGIAEICDAADMARSGLYYYIGSKEKLLVEIQNRVMQPMLMMGHRIADMDEDPVLRLRMLSQMLLEHILMWLDHIWVYEHDYRNLRGVNRRLLLDQRSEFEGIVQDLLTAAMEEGSIRKTDPRLATLQFLNLHNHTYQWVDPRGEWDAAHLSREYCATLFTGLCTPGHRVEDLEERMAEFLERRENFTTAPRTRRARKR
ncbi:MULTISPECIES: TetR/AcrR family transcriptional regulator [Streptacidiphilus]|uniref:TetR/AcrR family transcriptional regulator n=1 Tax=Streptacidiphilus cavernicola TaxID=3342716 RepID=A0ABV6UUZ3_9ACTN|nr:TetR/AcrR family transcriptional regulator [Streptacidiphilus jeojiense]